MLQYNLEIKSVEGMTGQVVIKVPSMGERLKFLKDSGINAKEDSSNLDALIKMMEALPGYVLSVDLKIDGMEIKDLGMMEHYDFGMAVYQEIAAVIMNGIPRGKN